MSDIQAQLQQALALHQAGRLAEARALYEAILKIQSDYFDALHLSGVLAHQAKDCSKAIELIGKAIAANPNSPEAHYNRANVFAELKQWDAALADYDRAAALKPSYVEAWYNRGVVFQELKQWDAALASYDRAITLNPGYAEAYANQGTVLQEQDKWDGALASYDKAIALKPDYVQAHSNRGNVLLKLRQWDGAIASCDKAIALVPGYVKAYSDRAIALSELGQADAALASCDRAIALKPDFVEAHSNRGNALLQLKRLDDALVSYDKAIALTPGYVKSYSNRGIALTELGQKEAALESHDRAIALDPEFAEAHFNKAFTLLLYGDLAAGWEEYEWRMKTATTDVKRFTEPLWPGRESAVGKTILIHTEQGLGDSIQFCRYVPMVADSGAKVIVMAQKSLVSLFAGLRGVEKVIAEDSPLPAFDYHCPLLSLPRIFKTRLNSIPATTKYLVASPARLKQWQARLGAKTKPRVGLSWYGNAKPNPDRSVALADLIRHLPEGFQYVSLQKELNETDKKVLQSHPEMLHFGNELSDFSDTAALCELMDVVISIDTSVAHLSAALGRPTWIMLMSVPDWRWFLDREDSPWYPSARLYRQAKRGDWSVVFEKIGADLRQKLAGLR